MKLENAHQFRERMRSPDWRDELAARAMAALLMHASFRGICGTPDNLARKAYEYADAMCRAMDGELKPEEE